MLRPQGDRRTKRPQLSSQSDYGAHERGMARQLMGEKYEEGRLAAYIDESLDQAVEEVLRGSAPE